MPNATIENYADEFAKDKRMARTTAIKKLEEMWEEAKEKATEKGFKEGDDDFYAYTMGIWKRMSGFKSESSGVRCVPITIDMTRD